MEFKLDLENAEDMSIADVAMATLHERYFWAGECIYPILTLPVLEMDGFRVGELMLDGLVPDEKHTYEITAFGTIGWKDCAAYGEVVAYLGNTKGYMTRDRWKKLS